MNVISATLGMLYDHLEEKAENEAILKDALISIVNNCYYGDFSQFLKTEITNGYYDPIRDEVERIYNE